MLRQPKAAMVFTTIYDPVLLDTYYENFHRFGHLDDVEVIVVPDRKTPAVTFARCADLAGKGMLVSCPAMDEQERFLRSVGMRPETIPYDSDNRRNVGYLMAYAAAPDFLISIDDDNYCRAEEDFIAEHAVVRGGEVRHAVAGARSGLLNICDLLEMECPGPVYARGYPYRFRHQPQEIQTAEREIAVHVNAGLWLGDPDVDAITWLVSNPRAQRFKGRSVVLDRGTWTPVNTQNTSLRREAIPAYYFVRMRYPLAGMPIDRYGDIFSGYFLQACAKHLGGYVRVGTPVADHRRNSHNYLTDATAEWACIQILEDLVPWLMEVRLEGSTYSETFLSLTTMLEDAVQSFRGPIWGPATLGYFHEMCYYMRTWIKACARIQGREG
jgi:Reversibly glycosylated polypeptide